MPNRPSTDSLAPRRRPPFPWGVVLFTSAYLSIAILGAILSSNREFLFYIAVMAVLIGVMTAVHRRVGFSPGVLWGLSVWGVAHMAGGLVPVPDSWPINGTIRVLYSWWLIPGLLKYDQIVHAYGFGVTTVVCWEGLRAAVFRVTGREAIQATCGLVSLCAAASMGFGALNEVIEFIATLLIPNTNVGDYANTGWDLVANLVGAVLAAGWLWFRGTIDERSRPVGQNSQGG